MGPLSHLQEQGSSPPEAAPALSRNFHSLTKVLHPLRPLPYLLSPCLLLLLLLPYLTTGCPRTSCHLCCPTHLLLDPFHDLKKQKKKKKKKKKQKKKNKTNNRVQCALTYKIKISFISISLSNCIIKFHSVTEFSQQLYLKISLSDYFHSATVF